jgi:predicted transglutaminase-like cysteine proteinase
MPRRAQLRVFVSLALAASSLHGCAHLPASALAPGRFAYFTSPAPDDPWTPKIAGWQQRERAAQLDLTIAPASVSGAGESAPAAEAASLRVKLAEFRRAQQRRQAQEVAAWVQENARSHYRPDGAFDHWATLEETLATDGDDCDGLELLSYHLLLDLGFAVDEVYRAIVVRPSDGQHHMVTLWFEDAGDPWVIDPTGAMTGGMPRMSEVPGWMPLKLFTEAQEFTVRSSERARAAALAASPETSRSVPGAR